MRTPIFYNLATRATHAPQAYMLHVGGVGEVVQYTAGRVLDEDITLGRAAHMYGMLTAFGREA